MACNPKAMEVMQQTAPALFQLILAKGGVAGSQQDALLVLGRVTAEVVEKIVPTSWIKTALKLQTICDRSEDDILERTIKNSAAAGSTTGDTKVSHHNLNIKRVVLTLQSLVTYGLEGEGNYDK